MHDGYLNCNESDLIRVVFIFWFNICGYNDIAVCLFFGLFFLFCQKSNRICRRPFRNCLRRRACQPNDRVRRLWHATPATDLDVGVVFRSVWYCSRRYKTQLHFFEIRYIFSHYFLDVLFVLGLQHSTKHSTLHDQWGSGQLVVHDHTHQHGDPLFASCYDHFVW